MRCPGGVLGRASSPNSCIMRFSELRREGPWLKHWATHWLWEIGGLRDLGPATPA